MEATMTENRLLVVWQDNETRLRHIIGELCKSNGFEFRYATEKAQELKSVGFNNLTAFPDIGNVYVSNNLFPAFSSRLPDKRRSDIDIILSRYDMDSYDEFELLKKSGGKLPIDSLEFVEPIDLLDKNIKRRFYIAGTKYMYNGNEDVVLSLKPQMTLCYQLESENSVDKNAVQILSQGNVIGYIPSYFSKEVTEAVISGRDVRISVLEVKPVTDENWHELIKAELEIE